MVTLENVLEELVGQIQTSSTRKNRFSCAEAKIIAIDGAAAAVLNWAGIGRVTFPEMAYRPPAAGSLKGSAVFPRRAICRRSANTNCASRKPTERCRAAPIENAFRHPKSEIMQFQVLGFRESRRMIGGVARRF